MAILKQNFEDFQHRLLYYYYYHYYYYYYYYHHHHYYYTNILPLTFKIPCFMIIYSCKP